MQKKAVPVPDKRYTRLCRRAVWTGEQRSLWIRNQPWQAPSPVAAASGAEHYKHAPAAGARHASGPSAELPAGQAAAGPQLASQAPKPRHLSPCGPMASGASAGARQACSAACLASPAAKAGSWCPPIQSAWPPSAPGRGAPAIIYWGPSTAKEPAAGGQPSSEQGQPCIPAGPASLLSLPANCARLLTADWPVVAIGGWSLTEQSIRRRTGALASTSALPPRLFTRLLTHDAHLLATFSYEFTWARTPHRSTGQGCATASGLS